MAGKSKLRAALTALVLAGSFSFPGASGAQVEVGSIGSFIGSLTQLVTKLNDSANQAIAAGNNALAQQQLILAGTIQQTIDRIESAYGNSLNKTFSQIDTTEGNAARDLLTTVGGVDKLETKTFSDVQNIIYQTQAASNQLLDRIPFTNRYPVFYAVSVSDLSLGEPVASDIEVIGYAFSDPNLNFKPPVVKVANLTLPAEAISVRNDRIEIGLPSQIKKSIGFEADPCNPRGTFPIDITVFYTRPRFFGLIRIPQDTTFHANALTGEPQFAVSVSYSGVKTVKSVSSPVFFSSLSGPVNVGCEDNGSTSVVATFPNDAIDPTCNSQWVNTSNLKNQSQTACIVTGNHASTSGNIRGLDYQRVQLLFGNVANCPGGGHGQLKISGNYRLPTVAQTTLTDVSIEQQAILAQDHSDLVLPADTSLNITQLRLNFNRKRCQSLYDGVTMVLPQNPLQFVSQTSTGGHFSISVRQSQLTIFPIK